MSDRFAGGWFLIGALLAAFVVGAGHAAGGWPAILAWGLALYGLLFVLVAMHEVGHLVAGWLAGFRFRGIEVRPFSFRPGAGGLRFVGGSLGGWARMVPAGVGRLRARLTVFVLGGPITHVVGAAVGYRLAAIHPSAGTAWTVFMLANVGMLLLSTVTAGENDLSHLWRIWGNGPESRSYLAAYMVQAVDADPPSREAVLRELGEAYVAFGAYHEAFRKQDGAAILAAVDQGLAHVRPEDGAIGFEFACFGAFWYAKRRYDVGRARAILPEEAAAKRFRKLRLWLTAATMLALAEARWSDARALSQRALKLSTLEQDDRRWFTFAMRCADRHLGG